MSYIELHTSSAFSFLDGATLPETLIERAAELGYPSLALLDRDGVYGAPQFYRAAKKLGIKAIVGAEITMGPRPLALGPSGSSDSVQKNPPGSSAKGQGPGWPLPVLVANAAGYRNLCRVITRAKLRSPKGEATFTLQDFDGHAAGLVALVGRQALSAERHGVGGLVDRLVGVFGASGVAVELQRHLLRDEEADNHALIDLASAFHVNRRPARASVVLWRMHVRTS